MEDDPLLGKIMLDRLELQGAGREKPLVWDAQAWLGKDINKLWFKSEGDHVNGDTETSEMQLLFSRAVLPYWDAQMGWRLDTQPKPQREWLVLGMQGLAPYFFEVNAAIFVGGNRKTGLRIDIEYEFLFTQKLILSSEIEVNFHGHNFQETGTGSGLSELEIGLRLRYEVLREFAPYVGISGWRKYGNSAEYAQQQGEHTDDILWVVGVQYWY